MDITTRSLKRLSAIVWYTGAAVLLMKGGSIMREAFALKPDKLWPWLSIAVGLIIGGLKAKFLFSQSCRKNLNRIDTLKNPKVWHCFRPWFFVFLAGMIMTGAVLSEAAHNNYPFLIGVATLDFSIAVALLGSSYVFLIHKGH